MALTLIRRQRGSPSAPREPLPALPYLQLLAGFLVGIGAGTAVNLSAAGPAAIGPILEYVVRPIEQTFLQLLLVLIPPLLFVAILSGIHRLRGQHQVRRLLLSTGAAMGAVSAVAALLGLAMANLFRPGDGVSPDVAQRLIAASQRSGLLGGATMRLAAGFPGATASSLLSAISRDRLAGLVLVALLLGIGLSLVQNRGSVRLLGTVESLFDLGMRLVGMVTRFTPLVVACFLFDLTTMFGWHLLAPLGAYVGVVIAALAIHTLLVFSALVWMLGGVPPLAFFRAAQEATLIAFSTSSSNATLPAALRVADERLHLPARVARLVLGVGTVANQAGTAIWVGVTVIFLSQLSGQDLGWGQQALVFAIAGLAGMGTIGVPGGSIPLVAMTLALLGFPPEQIGLVIGVDRLLDMFRTAVNVLGDLAIATALRRVGEHPVDP